MRRRCSLLLALVAMSLWGLRPARAETPEEVFNRGNEAYEEERYEEAARAYESLLKYRIQDARVEYNLGNALFRLGHLGLAILHYERARRLDPTDMDIRDNLAFARSMCFDLVEPPATPAPIRWLHRLQDRLGPDRQAIVGLLLLWCCAGVIGWSAAKPGRFRARHGWIVAALCAAILATGLSWSVTYDRLEGRTLAVVLSHTTEVLAGPGEGNPTLFTIHEGLTVEVRVVREEWVQVSLPNRLNGWVPAESVGLV